MPLHHGSVQWSSLFSSTPLQCSTKHSAIFPTRLDLALPASQAKASFTGSYKF